MHMGLRHTFSLSPLPLSTHTHTHTHTHIHTAYCFLPRIRHCSPLPLSSSVRSASPDESPPLFCACSAPPLSRLPLVSAVRAFAARILRSGVLTGTGWRVGEGQEQERKGHEERIATSPRKYNVLPFSSFSPALSKDTHTYTRTHTHTHT